jgi:hypothetical protein
MATRDVRLHGVQGHQAATAEEAHDGASGTPQRHMVLHEGLTVRQVAVGARHPAPLRPPHTRQAGTQLAGPPAPVLQMAGHGAGIHTAATGLTPHRSPVMGGGGGGGNESRPFPHTCQREGKWRRAGCVGGGGGCHRLQEEHTTVQRIQHALGCTCGGHPGPHVHWAHLSVQSHSPATAWHHTMALGAVLAGVKRGGGHRRLAVHTPEASKDDNERRKGWVGGGGPGWHLG